VGYASLMQRVIHQINLDYDSELRHFSGEMDQLHDFHEDLSPLLNPSQKDLEPITPQQSLTRGQKIALGWGMAGFLLLLTLLVFGCIFSIRLMPVAFPAPTKTPSLEFTSTPTLTHTPPPTFTPSPTPTLHPTVTLSATSLPSPTPTLQNISCTGVMNGNVWVRSNPIQSDTYNIAVLKDTPVEILAAYDIWVKISWEMETGDYEEGWVRSIWVDLSGPVPEQVITPVK